MKTIIDTSNKTPEEIAVYIAKLMDEVELMLRESTSQHAEEKIELLRMREDEVPSRLGEFYTRARDCAIEGAKRTNNFVRTSPYETALIALGFGVLVGAVLSRRERS